MTDEMKCPLCGYKFNMEDATCYCSDTKLCSGCSKFCCPNCGYKITGESKIIKWFKDVFSGKSNSDS
ncbi:MAG: hypothetical protein K8T10_12865 [Candidatus Eremiobacteraeota bacterium]|nr:hypothetical protein [Candidatus Eremiobacteraeota bacterium]